MTTGSGKHVGSTRKPAGIARGKITTSLWLGFGAVLLILGVTLLVYQWQFQQTSHHVELMTGTQQPLQQATWEMRQSDADIARYVSDYARYLDRDHVQELRDAEIDFDRAALIFHQLAQSDEARSRSQEINGTYEKLRKSADDVLSLVDSQQAALLSIRETAGEAAALMQGMLTATIIDTITHYEPALYYMIETHGIDRIVMGSDYPFAMGDLDPVSTVRNLTKLSAGDKQKIFWDNAVPLLKF
jgi:hypothetical protein